MGSDDRGSLNFPTGSLNSSCDSMHANPTGTTRVSKAIHVEEGLDSISGQAKVGLEDGRVQTMTKKSRNHPERMARGRLLTIKMVLVGMCKMWGGGIIRKKIKKGKDGTMGSGQQSNKSASDGMDKVEALMVSTGSVAEKVEEQVKPDGNASSS
ncbi:hypothetical protein L6452_18949 [Arctium lappa]|uniref:Uncharacterized protein n=1 Tax=Arctium lappa TaxID=4217 RepID=A0ACB9B935_ARCLA|nr:hypothetical protein L6452_18949 [Arctium lappa]